MKMLMFDFRESEKEFFKKNEFIDFDNKDILFMYSTLLINDSSSIR